jgi:VWFA-related protein
MRLRSAGAGIVALAFFSCPLASTRTSIDGNAWAAPPQGGVRGPLIPAPGADAPAQDGQPPQDQVPQAAQSLQVKTTIVNVFATVRGKHGDIMSDLSKDDFKVYEDGTEQKLAYFNKEVDLPITLALLMDTSGSMYRIMSAEQDAASRFVREVMRKRDEALVMSFDTDVNLLADFTEDPSVLDRAIHHAQVNAAGPVITPGTIPQNGGGGTNLYDAVYLACHDELGSEAGRKAVVLLTDAEDTGSKVRLEESVEAAQRADAVIHVILITDYGATEGYGPGVASKMAGDTGGRVVPVRNEKGLEKAFDEISTELRSQYVLGYYPSNPKRDGTFRKIKVEVTQPDAKVLARKGYYAGVQ